MNFKYTASLAILGTFASIAAHGQSAVTVAGYVDTYVEHAITGNGTIDKLGNAGLNQSRLTFSGVEDVGNGSKVLFDLEASFNPATGAGSAALFGRNAYIALVNQSYGEVRAGRLTTLKSDALGAFWAARWGASANAFMFSGWTTQNTNSAIRYESPSLYGLVVDTQYAFGGASGAAGALWEIKAQYDQGPFRALGAYYRSKGPHDLPDPNSTLSISTFGMSYDLGVVMPNIVYERTLSSNTSISIPVNQYNVDFALAVPVGPVTSVRLDYGFLRDQAVSHANARSASIRLDYSLSKRTILYTGIAKVWNDKNAYYQTTSASGSMPITSSTATYHGKASTDMIAGIRTSF